MNTSLRLLVICDSSGDAGEIGDELIRAGYDVSLQWASDEKSLINALDERDYGLFVCADHITNIDIVTARNLIYESGQDAPFIVQPVVPADLKLILPQPVPFRFGVALAVVLTLAVIATAMLTPMNAKDSLRIAIEENLETLTDFSTASDPED